MIDKNIVEYLNKYYKEYPVEALKEQLKNSGYSVQDIEDSVNYIQQGGLTTPAGEPALTPGNTWPWLRIAMISGGVILITVTGYFIFRGFSGSEQVSVEDRPAVSSGIKEETKVVSTSQQGTECNPLAGQKVLEASSSLSATYKDGDLSLILDPNLGFPENNILKIAPIYSLDPSICAKHSGNANNEANAQIVFHSGGKAVAKLILLNVKAGAYNFSASDFGDPGKPTIAIIDPANPGQKSPTFFFKGGSMIIGPNPLLPEAEISIDFRNLRGVIGIDGAVPVLNLSGVIKFKLPSKPALETPSFLPSCFSLGGEICPIDKKCNFSVASKDNNSNQTCCIKGQCVP